MRIKRIGRKISAIFLLSCMIGSVVQAEDSIKKGGMDAGYGRAAYATKRPEIDGNADDVWNTTEALYSKEGDGEAQGYVKVLWTEDTLYLLAKIEDPSLEVSNADSVCNCINFWVSETISQEIGYNNPGDWCLSVNADGDVRCSVGNREVLKKVISSAKKGTDTYTVELSVPIMAEGHIYNENDGIGFNISIDDEVNGDDVRDGFRSWQKYSNDVWYWENTEDLAVVQFVKQIDDLEDMTVVEEIEGDATGKEDKSFGTWQITVAVCCVVILSVLILVAIYLKRRQKRNNCKLIL